MTRGHRKIAIGIVKSDKMDKTIMVEAERRIMHPRFRKHVKAYTRYKAHDENNEARVGDKVRIMETRPLSKTKRWRLVEILRRAHGAEVEIANPAEAAAGGEPAAATAGSKAAGQEAQGAEAS